MLRPVFPLVRRIGARRYTISNISVNRWANCSFSTTNNNYSKSNETSVNESVPRVLFQNTDAASSVRLLSGGAVAHATYWASYTTLTLSGAIGTFTEDFYPSFLPEPAEASNLMTISSHTWCLAGLGLSGLFVLFARIRAESTVRQVDLLPNPYQKNGPPVVRVCGHALLGGPEAGGGTVLQPWNAATGGGAASFQEHEGMVTILPNGNALTTFHRILDTNAGTLHDKGALLLALARATPPPKTKDGTGVAPDPAVLEAESATKKAAHAEALKMRPRRRKSLASKKS
jgi:hypothetical protein